MRQFINDDTGKRFGMRLRAALKPDRDIILDFEGVEECELHFLKAILVNCRICREHNIVIKVRNAPPGLETIILLLDVMRDNLVVV